MKYFIKTTSIFVLLVSILSSRDYLWPTNASKTLTDVFGGVREGGRYHTGIDIRTHGINGFDVYAIESGYISQMVVSTSGYGKALYIKMADGNTSVYAHLDRFNENFELIKEQLQEKNGRYKINEKFPEWQLPVTKGDIIGFTGDTGGVSGSHLHFEIRNRKEKPFNPLLTNYTISDTIPPEPKSLIITNLNKGSYINEIPNETEFILRKVSENEYTYDEIISVKGEIGISLEVYDNINKSEFKYDVYSIKLIIDNNTMYESKCNNISIKEGYKVYSERDYSKHVYEGRWVYNLYNKYNLPLSSFVDIKDNKPLKFDDKSSHKCQIIVSDFNENQTRINFTLLSNKERYTTFDILMNNGLIVSSNDKNIKDIDVYLTDRFRNGSTIHNLNKEIISNQKVRISNNPLPPLDIIACQPIYKDGTRGATEYIPLKDYPTKLGGKINILDKEHGVVFQYIEKEFSGKIPTLGLTLDSLIYEYPLFRVSKNEFLSSLFYPRELRDLSKISIFFLDSTEHQFSIELNSTVSMPDVPFNISNGPINIISKEQLPNSKQLYGNLIHYDTFFYLMSTSDFINPNNSKIIYGPFLLGPQSHPLKNEVEIVYNATNIMTESIANYINQLGIYKFDKRKEKWKFINSSKDMKDITAIVKFGGIYSIIRDKKSPAIRKSIPKINSTYRHDHFDQIQFEIEDKLSGIKNENNIDVFLDGKKLIVEYNSHRRTVHYKLKNNLEIGSHSLKIKVRDNVGNTNTIDGEFFIQ